MSRLTFNADRHEYAVDGIVVPSVTQVLKATNVSVDFESLPNRDAIARKRDLGTAVHSDIHAADDGDLDWTTVHEDVRPYIDAWQQFRADKGLTPLARERRVYHPPMRYAGTFDGVFREAGADIDVLVDVKTGDAKSAAAQFQTAAYVLALAVEQPAAMELRRWSVQLIPGRRVPYVITPYADWNDYAVWQAIVTTYWASAQRRAA